MNDLERMLQGPRLAADGSGSAGAPRDDDPDRAGIDLGDMLEMGLESLLMHFRRKPGDPVMAEGRMNTEQPDDDGESLDRRD